jgi:glucose uptake protein GlcU
MTNNWVFFFWVLPSVVTLCLFGLVYLIDAVDMRSFKKPWERWEDEMSPMNPSFMIAVLSFIPLLHYGVLASLFVDLLKTAYNTTHQIFGWDWYEVESEEEVGQD